MGWMDELTGDWAAAKERVKDIPGGTQYPEIPDGKHKVVIVDANVDPDRPMIKFMLSFPDFKNIVRTKVIFVSGKLEYVHRELAIVGCDVSKPAELPIAVKSSIGKVIEITVKTKPGEKYSKMYFNSDTGERVAQATSDDPSGW